ncbi:putative receptor-like protein kinase At3g47110 [Corylus avellana]|uniref:putative receptor-like protein kinase At3g47110 n=1 Tax=Corylus avellana TaxID=13451 RepID=UPI00286BBB58|nr:putative receptor-like protein kinase At3g47110 [Corylus avellana]
MEHPVICFRLFFSPTSRTILLLSLFFTVSKFSLATTLSTETDKHALLEFKSLIHDTPSVLASWNESFQFCQWVGVTCGHNHQRVIGLNLKDLKLVGTISPHLGNLSFLRSLNLANNSFSGGIPSEVGHLIRLQNLNLSYNSLEGAIPVNLSHCSKLVNLDLHYNNLVQQIPSELGSLSKLEILSLSNNHLSGRFPPPLGNLSSLQQLWFAYNNLEGEIPGTVAKMTSLKFFHVGLNHLSGGFPASLYNLSSLIFISLCSNNLSGNLKPDLGIALPNLQELLLGGGNKFTGSFPASLANASNLQLLHISENRLTGNIPTIFRDLKDLQWLDASGNLFGNQSVDDLSFLTSLTNCSKLQRLDFSYNRLGGELPDSITNLSTQLTWLQLRGNFIGGRIPMRISNLVSLTQLGLDQNLLTGNIPASIGKLSNLNKLYLGANKLTGEIPSSFGNMTRLLALHLCNNSLVGSIPASLERCSYLQDVRLSHNKLNGSIPKQLLALPALSLVLNVSHNSLTGPLPPEVGNLKSLVALDLSYNKFSKEIPGQLKDCLALEFLYMQGNFFEGTIPDLSRLKGIRYLDLSHNKLAGRIPSYMQVSFPLLQNLNLSFNNLEGEVPVQGSFSNATAIKVYGNNRLCGGIQMLQLPTCKRRKHVAFKLILAMVIAAAFCLTLLSLISVCLLRKPEKKRLSVSSFGHYYQRISYQELLNATGGFSERNFIGSGNFGSVYKGILGSNGKSVAIKVLNLEKQGASKSFIAECQALRNIRHRNLVKILTACSSVDFEGKDFKALVYEFMPNGNLEMWLHPEDGLKQLRSLSLLQRMDIAIDVASALLYLHHHCQTPIIHCDLKPSNVLLDDDLTAHISDFGLARLLSESGKQALLNQLSSAGINGTVGYAPPEYGIGGQQSTNGDVYSFGILLLEIFTGRRPTDELFKDDLNLHNFVKLTLQGQVTQILDQSISNEVGETKNIVTCWGEWTSDEIECLILVIHIGLACSAESPRHRMDMRRVTLELLSIRAKLLGSGTRE